MLRMPHVADKDGWGYGAPFDHSDSNNNDAAKAHGGGSNYGGSNYGGSLQSCLVLRFSVRFGLPVAVVWSIRGSKQQGVDVGSGRHLWRLCQ
jgi:hypothetical protein